MSILISFSISFSTSLAHEHSLNTNFIANILNYDKFKHIMAKMEFILKTFFKLQTAVKMQVEVRELISSSGAILFPLKEL